MGYIDTLKIIGIFFIVVAFILLFIFQTFFQYFNQNGLNVTVMFISAGSGVIGVLLIVLSEKISDFVEDFTPSLSIYSRSKNISKDYSQQKKTTPFDDSRYIPSEVKQEVWERDGGRCVICGSKRHLEYDHDIPVSSGGSNTANNIRLLCRHCNRRKSGKIE
jgi:hypothetical protein